MSKTFSNPPAVPAIQATNVLRAWVMRDEVAFRSEIGRTLELCSMRAKTGVEEERLELLKAVAGPLRNAPFGTVSESMVHLCIDLLVHLAGQYWSAVGVSPAGLEVIG